MGIFGYNKKDYEKNTASFKKEIMDLMYSNVGGQFNNGKLLNAVLFSLDRKPPEKADWKAVENIDKRVEGLIAKLRRDDQQQKPAMFSAHANMMLSEIKDSRNYGMELLTDEERLAEESMHECKALINDALQERETVMNRMAEIEQQAQAMDESSPKFAYIEQEYGELEANLQTIERNVKVFTQRHNANLKVINTRKTGAAYKALPEKIVSARDFQKEIAQINKMAAEEAGYAEEINDAADEFATDLDSSLGTVKVSSGLRSKVEANKQAALESQIYAADAPATEAPVSGLRKKLGKQ